MKRKKIDKPTLIFWLGMSGISLLILVLLALISYLIYLSI